VKLDLVSSAPLKRGIQIMPLGLVSEELFDIEFKPIIHGRGNKLNTPPIIRELAARELIAGASLKEVSQALDISQSSASAYKNGATSTATYHKPDEDLSKKNEDVRGKIQNSAFDKLTAAMAAITPEKLNSSKVNIASAVARDMSQIIKNVTPEQSAISINKTVLVYKPRMREEDEYEVIDVQSGEK